MVPKFDIVGTQELSSADMQRIVGGDGWLQSIANSWLTGVNAIGSAITGLFASNATVDPSQLTGQYA
jgi:hypothetical protein